ncbi:MAG: hypothetical protein KJ896_00525 [Nanoarchaeota archaeon]|nr:hypothetical protein [Nanoarchaeota archaeon]
MARKKTTGNDIPNWVVLVLLVVVIVVSTVSIIIFMDAAGTAEPVIQSGSQGTVSLYVDSPEGEGTMAEDEGSGTMGINIVEPTGE